MKPITFTFNMLLFQIICLNLRTSLLRSTKHQCGQNLQLPLSCLTRHLHSGQQEQLRLLRSPLRIYLIFILILNVILGIFRQHQPCSKAESTVFTEFICVSPFLAMTKHWASGHMPSIPPLVDVSDQPKLPCSHKLLSTSWINSRCQHPFRFPLIKAASSLCEEIACLLNIYCSTSAPLLLTHVQAWRNLHDVSTAPFLVIIFISFITLHH